MGKIITTALPHDLPENWTDTQFVSPGGTEVGLTEKHGYNYLMKQVNEAQKAVNELDDALGTIYVSPLDRATPDTTGFSTLLGYIKSLQDKGKRRIEATVSDFPDMPVVNWGFKLIATRGEADIWDVQLLKALSNYSYVRQMYANGGWIQNTWYRVAVVEDGSLTVDGNSFAVARLIQNDGVTRIRNHGSDALYTEIEINLDGTVKCRQVNEGKVVYETLLSGSLAPATLEE